MVAVISLPALNAASTFAMRTFSKHSFVGFTHELFKNDQRTLDTSRAAQCRAHGAHRHPSPQGSDGWKQGRSSQRAVVGAGERGPVV
jgi:hypothetical protein